jgi:hypothetical protein
MKGMNGVYALLFTQERCEECPPAKVEFEELQAKMMSVPGVTWRVMDAQKKLLLASRCHVQSTPSFRAIVVENGDMVFLAGKPDWEENVREAVAYAARRKEKGK